MKTKFRQLTYTIFFALTLSGCGDVKSVSNSFEKASDECVADVVPKRFVVNFYDGRSQVIEANSKEEFLAGYLSENINEIAFAEHDFYVHSSASQMRMTAQTELPATNWGVERINAASLWQQDIRGDGIAVAVIDTGMDLTHPQLRKQVYANHGEQGYDAQGRDRSSNRIDDDGNGFVDDALGYDFVRNRPLQGDYSYHGTHVAGIIAAAHDDSQANAATYVQGVAPSAKILPLAFLNEQGSGAMSDGVRAIKYAALQGVRVINASWGGSTCSRSLKEVIASLEASNVLFVTASGNESSNIDRYRSYPASLDLPAQITVGSIGELDHMSEFSNYGSRAVHIFAPGSAIVSTVPGGLGELDGTSMATPFVAGAAALLLSAHPKATIAEIRASLYGAAYRRTEYINASQGRLNLANALSLLN